MKKTGSIWAACFLLCATLQAQTVSHPERGVASPAFEPTFGCTTVPDGAYDGSLDSMACITVPATQGRVVDVALDIALNHTWVGDLVFKIRSPEGTVLTIMSRPGLDEMVDDGSGCCGYSSHLVASSPVHFSDVAPTRAEDLGLSPGVVCQDDGLCSYFPFPDSGPGGGFVDFSGESSGEWMVCAGDALTGFTGEICDVSLEVTTLPLGCLTTCDIPVLDEAGLVVLLLSLGSAGLFLLRRRT